MPTQTSQISGVVQAMGRSFKISRRGVFVSPIPPSRAAVFCANGVPGDTHSSEPAFPSSRAHSQETGFAPVKFAPDHSAASACGKDSGQDFSRSRKSASSQRPARPSGRSRSVTR